ncbi:HlyD family efflux transporter periplasmic adaptor subunit [Alphaproteobacteria bacterium]|nr:HlyD family efflux transporter periplasmic adaptor subunit [Alphaproteobacteria bacterium]MDC0148619.1 HlyD family efflux transporter periplasmic adaptor subunit [Alphaproteobacteria bacterium]
MKWLWLISQDSDRFSTEDVRLDIQTNRWMIRVAALMLLVFVLWASWAEIDTVTRAEGEVIASSKTQIIQSEENGSISTLHVQEGDFVKRGDLLAELNSIEAEAAYLEALSKKVAVAITLERLAAEVFGTPLEYKDGFHDHPEFVENQQRLFNKRKQALDAELSALREIEGLARQELGLNEPLVAEGHVSETEVLRLKRQVAELGAQQTNLRNQFFRDAQAEMGQFQEEYSVVEQALVQRQKRLKMTKLVSPADGIVANIRVRSSGGVVRASEEVMQIVPANDVLIVEAKVSPVDIAFLSPGLPVTVKISAYDYTVYGDFQGELVYISADTLLEEPQREEEPSYRIRVKTNTNRFHGKLGDRLKILPGMTATVEVITGQSTVLSYLVKPLVKTFSESLGER